MFDSLEPAAPDPILGLTEAFRGDPNPNKINLSVGVYQDASGKTPVLQCVKQAEEKLLTSEATKSYLPIPGSAEFDQAVLELMLGADHAILQTGRAAAFQTPGAQAPLRVAADFIKTKLGKSRIWVSAPTWPNHPGVFKAAGLEVESYPYFDAPNNALDESAMLAALAKLEPGEVVLLHACCHNPSGIDPSVTQWEKIAQVVQERNLLPLVDFAYQGFGDGLEEDAVGLRTLCESANEMLICSSFSKNFGLYRERTGALTLVGSSSQAAQLAVGHMKICVRTNYSNPPAHGAGIVTTILADESLRSLWLEELAAMRDRINGMRNLFVETLKAKGVPGDFSFIAQQRGMFSFSGLNKEQVDTLREKHSIYIVGSGRINVAGMTEANMDPLCEAIASVY